VESVSGEVAAVYHRTKETAISAARWALWLGKGLMFTFTFLPSKLQTSNLWCRRNAWRICLHGL